MSERKRPDRLFLEVLTPDPGGAMVEVSAQYGRRGDGRRYVPAATVGTDALDAVLGNPGTRARDGFARTWWEYLPTVPSGPVEADLVVSDMHRILLALLDLTRTAETGEPPVLVGYRGVGNDVGYVVGFGSEGFAGYLGDACDLSRVDGADSDDYSVTVGLPDGESAVRWTEGLVSVEGESDMARCCRAVADDLFDFVLGNRVHVNFRDGFPVMVADDVFAALAAVLAMALESDRVGVCRGCGNPMRVPRRGGVPRAYCSETCRQRYLKARRWWELVRVEGFDPDVAARAVSADRGRVSGVVRRNLGDMESHVREVASERGVELPPTPGI